jgi:uncharacterized protein YeaO (DUF488 family)
MLMVIFLIAILDIVLFRLSAGPVPARKEMTMSELTTLYAEACTTKLRTMTKEQHDALGTRVLVMRQWPRGLPKANVDVWMPDAGPSFTLLQSYRSHVIDWTEFERLYRQEQLTRTMCRVVRYSDGDRISDEVVRLSPLKMLYKWGLAGQKITVMCWENDLHCHRHILVDLLKEMER